MIVRIPVGWEPAPITDEELFGNSDSWVEDVGVRLRNTETGEVVALGELLARLADKADEIR